MEKRTLTVRSRGGISARTAAAIVSETVDRDIKIKIDKDGVTARGDSIIQILFLNADRGDTLEIAAEGVDSKYVVDRIAELFEGGAGI